MTLAEVFAQGHTVATSRAPRRYVVACAHPPAPQGWWVVRPEAIAGVAFRRVVSDGDLGGSLGANDVRAEIWAVDDGHCWCAGCSEGRKLLETQSD